MPVTLSMIYSLIYNKARQAAITQELSEIVSGAAAFKLSRNIKIASLLQDSRIEI